MTVDVKLTKTGNIYDLTLNDEGDFTNGDFLDTSLQYSLLGERRASAAEVPQNSRRRGDIISENSDFENGSKLWLFYQERITLTVKNKIISFANEALIWLVDDGLLESIEVTAVTTKETITLTIVLKRPFSKVETIFFPLWENTGV
jgi:phage gp46-like protein